MDGVVVSYVHNAAAPGLGKIGVLVALESGAPTRLRSRRWASELAMHIAAAIPAGAERRCDLIRR